MNIALDTTDFTTNGVGVRSSRMDKKWCHLYWGNRPIMCGKLKAIM